MFKKFIALLLVLLLTFALAACGGSSAPAAPTDTPAKPETGSTPTAPTDAPVKPEESNTPAAPETPPAKTEEDSSAKGFRHGAVDGNVYTSTFLGIRMTATEDWVFAGDEELAQMGGLVQELLDDETLQKQLENGSVIYDLYAMDLQNMSNVNLAVEKLGLAGVVIDEDAYVDITMQQLPDALASAGVTVTQIEKTSLDFAGASHSAITLSAEAAEGVTIYETIVLVKVGLHMAVISAATYNADATADVLAMFSGI